MDTANNEIYAAFGLDEPSAEETTAPDETTGEPGTGPEDSKPAVETQDVEAQAEQDEGGDAVEEQADEVQRVGVREESTAQTAEDTSQQDANYAAAFMGRNNPYTGKPITTKADYDQYLRDREKAEADEKAKAALERIKDSNMDAETFEAMLANTEIGKQFRRTAETAKRIEEENHRQAIDRMIAEDIAEIAKYDPTVKDVDTLKATAKGKQIAERVNSGRFTWLEAWKLENFDAISNARSEATKQAAMNAAASKDHLQSTAQRGSGEVEIPRDVQETFNIMGITDAEEQRTAYRDYLKSIKKG